MPPIPHSLQKMSLLRQNKKRGDSLALKYIVEQFADSFDGSFGETVYICCADCMDLHLKPIIDLIGIFPKPCRVFASQIAPFHYVAVFEPYIKEKKSILYLSLSGGLSNTYESAQLAVEMLNVRFIRECANTPLYIYQSITGE